MATPLLFANVGWMNKYAGQFENDHTIGNHGCLKNHKWVSDRLGMREAAYAAWMRFVDGHRSWYDEKNNEIVQDESVPERERFCPGDPCQRWHIVLRQARCTEEHGANRTENGATFPDCEGC